MDFMTKKFQKTKQIYNYQIEKTNIINQSENYPLDIQGVNFELNNI